nr:MAG TPA: hypothetical protein [Caudoviricetes sp.]DAN80193.1 MAG TPA: hypothetical protein [Caudoviricetes sp.]DAZ37396.1 MAG TPA: hypothetical protein [Caudoviricetes sp.]
MTGIKDELTYDSANVRALLWARKQWISKTTAKPSIKQ